MPVSPVLQESVLKLETETTPNLVIVHCSGRLMTETCDEFQHSIRGLLRIGSSIAIDFSNVNYVDSSALGAIVGLFASAKRIGCQFRLINLTPQVKNLLNMTGLMEVLGGHAKQEMFGQTPA